MKRLLLTTFLAATSFAASATVIDFNGVTGNSNSSYGTQYQEEGFQLNAERLATIRPDDTSRYTGSTSFFDNYVNGVTTLKKIDGSAFSIDSIDLDGFNRLAANVTFTATLLNNTQTSTTFTTDASYGLQTFVFSSAFDNVKSVSWTQASPYHSFDNIVVGAAQVPEPGTVAVFGLGLLAFTAARRKSVRK